MKTRHLKLCALFAILCIVYLYYIASNSNPVVSDKTRMILHNHYYINLDHRTDRKHETIRELSNIGLYQPNRYNAIKHRMGIAGCGMSHIGVLETAKERGVPYVTIFEDDVMFLNPRETLTKLDRIINSKIEWDVILLGGNNFKPYDTLNDDCIRVYNCQCCTAYIVKQSYYDTLINHWKQGLQKLIQTGDIEKYALDQYWKNLQQRDMYLLITPLNVVQRESYSDIEHQSVDYVSDMKNVN
jgi:hypothetical protein